MKVMGMVLVAIGLVALLYGGFQWTNREKVIDAGPIQVSRDKTHSVPISPIAGVVCIVAGAGLMMASSKATS